MKESKKWRFINDSVNFYHSSWLRMKRWSIGGMILTGDYRFFFSWLESPGVPRSPDRWGFCITLRHTTLGRTRLDEWSGRPDAETSTWQHTISMPAAGFEHPNLGKRAAADPCLRPRDHCNQRATEVLGENTCSSTTLSTTIQRGLIRDRTQVFEARNWQQIKIRSYDYMFTSTAC